MEPHRATDDERALLREWVSRYKRLRGLLHSGARRQGSHDAVDPQGRIGVIDPLPGRVLAEAGLQIPGQYPERLLLLHAMTV